MSTVSMLALSQIVFLILVAMTYHKFKKSEESINSFEPLIPVVLMIFFLLLNTVGIIMVDAFPNFFLSTLIHRGGPKGLALEALVVMLSFYMTRDDSKFIKYIGRHNEPGPLEKRLGKR